MTVVYIDMVFALNFMANYLLLLCGGRLSGAILRRGRIALGGALGGLYAAAVFFPGLAWLTAWPIKWGAGVLMALVAYGWSRNFPRICLIFFGASCLLGGMVFAAELMGNGTLTMENGIYYSRYDLRLLLVLFVLCYAVLSFIFRNLGRHGPEELARLEIRMLGKEISLIALIDTGNTLTDSATNRPVVIAEFGAVRTLLPSGVDPARPVESAEALHRMGLGTCRLLPFRAVGTPCGMLLALRSEWVRINGKNQGPLLVALSPGPVSDGGAYQSLIGGI